jgi:molybdate transport system regulatory protein
MVASMRLSARNQLPGTVASVDLGAVMATVVIRLEGGEELVAAITKESAQELGLAEGDAVTAVIKATEIMVGKD